MLDKFEIKSIRAWTFLTSTVPNRPPYFILLETFHQQLTFLLSDSIKANPIQLWSALVGVLESLLKEPVNLLFYSSWFINPGAINSQSVHSVVSTIIVNHQVEVPGVTIPLSDPF